MARPIFGGKKIDAPVFLFSLAVSIEESCRKTLSLLVDRYFILSSCFFSFGIWVLSSLKLERSAGSLLKKECYSGEDENPPKPGPKSRSHALKGLVKCGVQIQSRKGPTQSMNDSFRF